MRLPVLSALTARPRLLFAMAAGIAAGLLGFGLATSTRVLLGWNVCAALDLLLVLIMVARSSPEDMQSRADREDPGAAGLLLFFIAAALASLAAIALQLPNIKGEGGAVAFGTVGLIVGTVLLSWLFAHTMFGLHYAHDYYAGEEDRKGLKFPGETPPDYWDFLYFSFNLGAAAQTSDVQVESPRMRRTVLAHTIVSFLFNTGVLALAVNVGASLLGAS